MQKLAEERLKKLSSMKKLNGPYSVKIADVKTGSWRRQRPVVDPEKCVGCGTCAGYCPCGVIEDRGKKVTVAIDYTYCKGCGICAQECPRQAIAFVDEAECQRKEQV